MLCVLQLDIWLLVFSGLHFNSLFGLCQIAYQVPLKLGDWLILLFVQVVELLIRKLESEPSFHRKVDLFFLVDSITQISHTQKGIRN